MMYDTGQAPLPGLKSMAAVSGKTNAQSHVVSENDSADGTFSTELSAARERLTDGTESTALDDPNRRQYHGDATDGPHASADDVENTDGKNTHPVAQDQDIAKDADLNPSQQSLPSIAVSDEQNPPAAQAKDKSEFKQSGLDSTDSVTNRQIDTDADTATDTDAHAHARIVTNANALSDAGAVIRNDAGHATDRKGLPASLQRRLENDTERTAGLLPGKDDSIPRGKNTLTLQPLPHAGSNESLVQLDPDHASRTKADDTTFGLARGSLESDGVKAGVILAGLNPTKTLPGNTRLHSDTSPSGKTAANSQLGHAIRFDAVGNALPQKTTASLLADRNLPPAPGNTALHETVASAQEITTVKRAGLMNDGAEKNAAAMKTETAGHSVQTEGARSGFNVEELLFQRSLSVQQTSGVNSDSALHQSNSPVNMFHTFGSGILTAPVTARGLPEAGMMMTAPTTVSLLGENAGNDIAGNIRWMKSEGLKSAVINVSPSGMGPISVKIGIEDETMNVSFVALQGATRDALDSALPRLRDQLLSQGNESVRVDVSDGKAGQNRSGAEGQFAENRQNQSDDNGGNGVGTQSQIYGEQIPEVDELTSISGDNLPGEHTGKQVVRYDLYV